MNLSAVKVSRKIGSFGMKLGINPKKVIHIIIAAKIYDTLTESSFI
jgi:hypothetical protein